MEVRKGFKFTPLGLIPNEWKVITFGDLPEKSNRWGITGGPFGSNLKKSDYVNDGVRILQLQNIGDGDFLDDYKIYTSKRKADELISCNIYPGEIILSKMGDPVARCCFIPLNDRRYLMASDGIRLVVDEKRFDKRLVKFYINSTYFRKKAIEASTGTTRQRIGLVELKTLPFISPPIAEQHAIAEALSDVDALISSLEELIAKKRVIKQGVMQELLTGKRRLPGLSDLWEIKKLVDMVDIRSGGTPSTLRQEYWGGEIPWCTPTDITALKKNKYIYKTKKMISEFVLKNSSAEIIPSNSIIMTSRATIGECAINKIPISTNQGFKNLIPKDGVDVEFLYYVLQTKKQELISLSSGSTFLEINKGKLAKVKFYLPKKKPEQSAIAKILSSLDLEINILQEKLNKAKLIKQGMMQELLTGRIRLIKD
ncbi:MAG: hypothetical protein FP831_19310 [Anaerolineae bacterium]|nr:hypothetical protein [Anaerolineae bacterium]